MIDVLIASDFFESLSKEALCLIFILVGIVVIICAHKEMKWLAPDSGSKRKMKRLYSRNPHRYYVWLQIWTVIAMAGVVLLCFTM